MNETTLNLPNQTASNPQSIFAKFLPQDMLQKLAEAVFPEVREIASAQTLEQRDFHARQLEKRLGRK